jgi:hypothetical protein
MYMQGQCRQRHRRWLRPQHTGPAMLLCRHACSPYCHYPGHWPQRRQAQLRHHCRWPFCHNVTRAPTGYCRQRLPRLMTLAPLAMAVAPTLLFCAPAAHWHNPWHLSLHSPFAAACATTALVLNRLLSSLCDGLIALAPSLLRQRCFCAATQGTGHSAARRNWAAMKPPDRKGLAAEPFQVQL